MPKLSRKVGTTSQTVDVFIQDTSSATGGGLTGLVYNSSGLTAYYNRTREASTVISLATLAAATSAWSSGGFKEIDSTGQPGMYRFDIPNAVLASGVDSAHVYLQGATNMAPVVLEIDLDAQVDVTHWNGTAVKSPSTAGVPEVRLTGTITHGASDALVRAGSSSSTPAIYATASSTGEPCKLENTAGGAACLSLVAFSGGGGTAFNVSGGGLAARFSGTSAGGILIQGGGSYGVAIEGYGSGDALQLYADDTGKCLNLYGWNEGGSGQGSIAGYLTGVASPTFVGPGVLPKSPVQANTALANFEFVMYDTSGDPATGKTVTATRSIDGGAFAACANAVTEVGSGVYKISLATSDLNGNVVTFKFSASGCEDTLVTIVPQSLT